MINGKLGREEIVCFATELLGWEEVSYNKPVSILKNTQTNQTAELKIHPNNGDEFIWLKVDGQEIYTGTLTKLQDI